ncbi:MAG: tyrosine-type recombinase/integrase [Nitrososphaerota archaeon]|jgi:integrase/ribosomal protein L40E|nr:tyrosine-type recombinase/integrase [Nitrososphaerota archaeon]
MNRNGDDLYGYAARLKLGEKLIAEDPQIRAADKKLILSFLRHIKAKELSIGRQAKYAFMLKRCAQLMRVPFRRAKRADYEDLVTKLADFQFVRRKGGEPQHYTPATMADFRLTLKVFGKFVREGHTDRDVPYPEEVRWMKKDMKLNEKRDPLYFTDAEIEALIKAADNDRDKAIIAIEGELGLRPGELLGMLVGWVTVDDAGAVINVGKGKTGPRRLRSIGAVYYLTRYLENHPLKDDPNAPLWLTRSTSWGMRKLGYHPLQMMLKETAKKAGIAQPRVFTYMLRHGSATRNARYLTDSELKLMYGWSMSSRMTGTYVHLSGGDLDAKYQEIYGQGKVVSQPTFAPLICPRCHEKSPVGARYCVKCASPLEQEERAKMTVKEEENRNEIAELRKLVERTLNPPASQGGTGSSPGRTA